MDSGTDFSEFLVAGLQKLGLAVYDQVQALQKSLYIYREREKERERERERERVSE